MPPILSGSVNILDKSSLGLQDLSTLTVKQLRHLSTEFGVKIKSRAKKDHIIQSLLDYKKNGTPPTLPTFHLLRRPHKGPRITSKAAKRETLSMRRVRNALGVTGSNEIPSGLRVNLMSPLEWSKTMISKAEGRISDCPDSIPSAGSNIETPNSHLTESKTAQVEGAQADRHRTDVVQGPTISVSVAIEAAPTSPPYSHMSAIKTPTNKVDPYSISLGAGAQLRYGEADLYEPRSLAGLILNPDTLHSMWDDTSSAWASESLLVIRGVPVAIKYWRDFYSNFKHQKVWDSIKQNWHSFRVLMQEYEELGKDGFRSKWSMNGDLIPSLRIVATLRSSNRDRDEELVTAVKQNLSEQQFNSIFSYKSKAGTRVLTSPSAIAKRYSKLRLSHGITPIRFNTSAETLALDVPRTPCSLI